MPRNSSTRLESLSLGEEAPFVQIPPPGPRSRELSMRMQTVECPAFSVRRGEREALSQTDQVPIVYTHACGSNVWDADDNRYVDLVAGFGALLLGHNPPGVTQAVAAQAQRLSLALGDVYGSDVKLALCERVIQLYPEAGAQVMLGLSGADAVTCAMKTAMLSTHRAGILAFEGGYHGLSHGPLAACGLSESFRRPFAGQLAPDVVFAPYPSCAEELDRALATVETALRTEKIGAVLVEPLLGRGGCVVPPSEFLPALRTACDRYGALLIADEIWTGLGRTGACLASCAAGVLPDLICLAKGLGGGLPLSACIGRRAVMQAWGQHGGAAIHTATHFGSPLGCSAALATLEALDAGALGARAADLGGRWQARLREETMGLGVKAVRGQGLMVGVQLEGGAGRALAVMRKLLHQGYLVLTGGVAGDVLTLTPPLTIAETLLDSFVDTLAEVLPLSDRALPQGLYLTARG